MAERSYQEQGVWPMPTHPDPLHLFWVFIIMSIVGLVAETLVSFPIDGIWKDRAGLVWGPFSPIYGLGAVLLTLCLFKLRRSHPLLLFAVAGLIGGAFEWLAGTFWEEAFGFVAWSYIDQPFNIQGHTSLGIALVWGAAGLLWMRWLLPLVWRLVDAVPKRALYIATLAAAAFMALDIALTLGAFSCWFDRRSGVPVETPAQAFFAEHFSDEFMDRRFQTISMYPVLASR